MELSEPARNAVFWSVCIPLRVWLATRPPRGLRVFALVIGLRWMFGLENGNEGMFGGPVWWAPERWLHGAFWTIYAVTGDRTALWFDVGTGALNFLAKKTSALANTPRTGRTRPAPVPCL